MPGILSTANPSRKVALVTGASYGVGAAIAKALVRDGLDVALTATRSQNLASNFGNRSRGRACDSDRIGSALEGKY